MAPTPEELKQAAKTLPRDRTPTQQGWVSDAKRFGDTITSNLDAAAATAQKYGGK